MMLNIFGAIGLYIMYNAILINWWCGEFGDNTSMCEATEMDQGFLRFILCYTSVVFPWALIYDISWFIHNRKENKKAIRSEAFKKDTEINIFLDNELYDDDPLR
jgi:hypothetical protein